jgi:hypothetical protein
LHALGPRQHYVIAGLQLLPCNLIIRHRFHSRVYPSSNALAGEYDS